MADEITDKDGNVIGHVVPGANGPRFFTAKPPTPGLADKEEIKSIYKQIDRLKEDYDREKDTSFSLTSPLSGVPNEKKKALETQIEALRQKAKALEGASGKKKSDKKVEPVVGKTYINAEGKKATYMGNGEWKELP